MKPRWQILAELIKTHEFRCVAEVGVNRGLNALGVLELCPEIEKMYLIDRSFGVFDSGAFKPYNTKIIGIEATSEFAADYIKNQSLDLVFIDYIKGIKKDKKGNVILAGTNIHDVRRRLENLNNIGKGMGNEKNYLDSIEATRKEYAEGSQEARALDAIKAKILGATPKSRNAFFRHHGGNSHEELVKNVSRYFQNERDKHIDKNKQSGSPNT
jgi:hypothetical protein